VVILCVQNVDCVVGTVVTSYSANVQSLGMMMKMNPFEEDLSEEEIKHRKMWNSLNSKEKMDWVFNQLMYNPKTRKWVERKKVQE